MTPDFIPPNDSPPTAQEELDALEALDLRDDSEVVVSQEPPPPPGRSYAFDFTRHRFLVAPGGRGPLETRGDSTLAYWIEKVLQTSRDVHSIYPPGYGMDRPFDEVGLNMASVDEADLESRVTDALTYHPRISAIADFFVSQDDPFDDTLLVSFRVVKDDDTDFTLTGLTVA